MQTIVIKLDLAVFPVSDFDPKESGRLLLPAEGIPLDEYLELFPIDDPYDEFEWYWASLKNGKIRVTEVEWIE